MIRDSSQLRQTFTSATTEPQCRVCHGQTRSYLRVAGCSLSRCHNCDFLQVNEKPTEASLEALYRDTYFSKDKYAASFSQRHENNRRLDLLRRFAPPSQGPVLEAGCGTGEFVSFAKRTYDIWGCDYSSFAVEKAREANPELGDKLWSTSLEDPTLPSEKFSAVVMWDVIEHLWDVRTIARKLMEAVVPGGHMILSTPDAGSLSSRLLKKHWAFLTVPEHLSFFSKPTAQRLFVRDLGGTIRYARSAGKWVNLGFLAYKFGRSFPGKTTQILQKISSGWMARFPVYVPTGDILYLVVKKPGPN